MVDVNQAVPGTWRKSSHSQEENCVEVAFAGAVVAVRDSKDPAGGVLAFSPDDFRTFLDRVPDLRRASRI